MDDETLLSYCERLVSKPLQHRNDGATPLNDMLVVTTTRTRKIKKEKSTRNIEESRFNLQTDNPTPELTTYGGIKLGWIQGVLIPCLLNIWGVMLFLRIAWIVAQAGIALTIAIIALSSVVCVITTLSLSAICTNGRVAGGGVYYLVSRSLGAEFGASVGIIFAFANAVAASMNTIGFCESLNELLRHHGLKIIDNSVNDIRIVGAIALLVMCIICAIGMDWETKTQNFLIVVILMAISNYVIGSCMGPRSDKERAQGFVGINGKTAEENWKPDYRQGNNFASVFAMYFPAVTGVQAGANICGDLKDPAEAIPKGTLTALAVSISSYLAMAVLSGVGARRDASGRVADVHNNTLEACKPDCGYGLHNNHEIMQVMSLWGPLIYAGCWAATLSTALTNLLSVPRLIQALGIDRIYPGLIFFSKRYGRHGEPYRGYVLTFLVSLLFLLIADLDTIAPLITNVYLASYALINFCTFHAAFIHHISWRPTFRYYNTWLSLAGFCMCVGIMIVISWMMALITVGVFGILFMLVLYRKPEATWGSSTDAYRYRETITKILAMSQQSEHVIKNYNPQLLVLTGRPCARTALLDVAHLITKTGSFMIVGDITHKSLSHSEIQSRKARVNNWLHSRKYRSFYALVMAADFEVGVRTLVQCAGLGRLAPNILLIGYKSDWSSCSHEDLFAYVRVLQYAFEHQLGLCIFRLPPYYQSAEPTSSTNVVPDSQELPLQPQVQAVMHSSSDFHLKDSEDELELENQQSLTSGDGKVKPPMQAYNRNSDSLLTIMTSSVPNRSTLYTPFSLNSTATLDAWWLYDDGGLSILLPYIIADRGVKNKMPLRVFALARQEHKVEEAHTFFETLLKMFRIEYALLSMVTGLTDFPSEDSWELFKDLVEKYKNSGNSDCVVTEADLVKHNEMTTRHLRLRELLIENSSAAGLIVISLPAPRKGGAPAPLYMSWLEALGRGLPPVLLVRGNQSSVLNA